MNTKISTESTKRCRHLGLIDVTMVERLDACDTHCDRGDTQTLGPDVGDFSISAEDLYASLPLISAIEESGTHIAIAVARIASL